MKNSQWIPGLSVLLGAAFSMMGAAANPNGAPWGSADPDVAQNCSSCHFDGAPSVNSHLLSLAGLPEFIAAGETYQLTLGLAPGDAMIAGFMLSANAGAFHHPGEGVETNEQEARSVRPVPASAGAQWKLKWTAPADLSGDVIFYAAVNGANDDASPFGDIIHYRAFKRPIMRETPQPAHPGESREPE